MSIIAAILYITSYLLVGLSFFFTLSVYLFNRHVTSARILIGQDFDDSYSLFGLAIVAPLGIITAAIAPFLVEAWSVAGITVIVLHGLCLVVGLIATSRTHAIIVGRIHDRRRESIRGAVDPRALESLVSILRCDMDAFARSAAAEALGKIGDPRATDPLMEALGDKDDEVRQTAREALQQLDKS